MPTYRSPDVTHGGHAAADPGASSFLVDPRGLGRSLSIAFNRTFARYIRIRLDAARTIEIPNK
jgi:hypothetical protein